MTKIWFAAATSFRASSSRPSPVRFQSYEVLQRRMDRFGPRRDAARSAPLEAPPQPLDARLIADGEALEAAWQAELRAMIAARRGGAEALAAARAARAQSEAIVARIEATRALTLDGHKVKARAESWRRDGEPLAPTRAETSRTTACGPTWRTCRATKRRRRGRRLRRSPDAVGARAGRRSPPVRRPRRARADASRRRGPSRSLCRRAAAAAESRSSPTGGTPASVC